MLTNVSLTPFYNTCASTPHLPSSCARMKGWYFFQQYMARGNTSIPQGSERQLREDGKPLMEWFLSMATPDEKKVLLPPAPVSALKDVSLLARLDPSVQEAMRKFISLRLDVLVRARLILCYFDARLPCPPLLLSCGGVGRNAQTDDSLSAGAVAQHVKYLRAMGQTAQVPVLQNMLEWRRKHRLYTFDPETVLQLPDVLHQIDDKWAVRATATKKELVLEGFHLLPEWADTVNGKIRTRVWMTGRKVDEDDEWMKQHNKQLRAQKESGNSVQADGATGA